MKSFELSEYFHNSVEELNSAVLRAFELVEHQSKPSRRLSSRGFKKTPAKRTQKIIETASADLSLFLSQCSYHAGQWKGMSMLFVNKIVQNAFLKMHTSTTLHETRFVLFLLNPPLIDNVKLGVEGNGRFEFESTALY